MSRIFFGTRDVCTLGVENPADDSVVDGNTDERAEYLGEEDRLGRNVHVMADFHVLQDELCAVPSIASNGTIGRCTARVLVSRDGVYHEAVPELICSADGLYNLNGQYHYNTAKTCTSNFTYKLEIRKSIKPSKRNNENCASGESNKISPNGYEKETLGENDNHDNK